jgi:hypothetical protein
MYNYLFHHCHTKTRRILNPKLNYHMHAVDALINRSLTAESTPLSQGNNDVNILSFLKLSKKRSE